MHIFPSLPPSSASVGSLISPVGPSPPTMHHKARQTQPHSHVPLHVLRSKLTHSIWESPTANNMTPHMKMLPSTSQPFDIKLTVYHPVTKVNKIFADKVTEVINPDEDYVWVHDYHLMILPTLLRKRVNRVKLRFFLHNTFPSSEIFRTIPIRDDILRALLNCDLVGFHTFNYSMHFLSCYSRMLGLDYVSRRGYIGLEYYGRTVTVKILPVGIHMGQLESIFSLAWTAERVRELREEFEGKVVGGVCRQDSPVLDKALGDEKRVKESVIIMFEFIGCSSSLSGAIKVNPWNNEI